MRGGFLDIARGGHYLRNMNLLDYTMETGFLPKIKCESVEAAVTLLVEQLASSFQPVDRQALVAEILRREAEGSTAIGGGLVIPHARFTGVPKARVGVATLAEPLPVQSTDGLPVDVVILLVGPQDDPRQMLRVLARLARLVKQDKFLDSLRQASDAFGLRAAFSQVESPLD